MLFPSVSDLFAILLPAGFVGGHGTAAAFGDYFSTNNNWGDALTIGQTFSSIGLIVGTVLEDCGLAWTVLSFLEVFVIAIVPIMVGTGNALLAGVLLTLGGVLLLVISAAVYGVHTGSGAAVRTGETDYRVTKS